MYNYYGCYNYIEQILQNHFISKKPILSIKTYKNLETKNEYFKDLSQCAEGTVHLKQYDEKEKKQMHQIIPQYVFNNKFATAEDLAFRDSTDNIIELSVEDHILAHKLLYEEYGNTQNQGATNLLQDATNLLQGLMQESKKIWCSSFSSSSKRKNFWDPEFQKEMAQRSMQKPDALETRSAGGKKGGRNKSKNTAIKAHERFVFSFEGKEVFCTENCETGGEVLEQLKGYENSTNQETRIERTTPLVTEDRKLAYG